MLTSCVALFLKRPPEMHKVLALIMRYIFTNEKTPIDLKDRAAFYYRALENNPEEVKKGFA